MISSILVSEKDSRELRRTLHISVFCSVFCLIFYLFLCVIPYGLFLLVREIPGPSLLSGLFWNTGTAAVTVSSLLRGVFDIAGNSSIYQAIMMAAGFFLLFCGLILYFVGIMSLKKLH